MTNYRIYFASFLAELSNVGFSRSVSVASCAVANASSCRPSAVSVVARFVEDMGKLTHPDRSAVSAGSVETAP
jgi:hypothetical protein